MGGDDLSRDDAGLKTGVISVCTKCDSQGRCECRGAKRHKVPVIRVDALRVPIAAATGNYEDLGVPELNELLWDLNAEITRRLQKLPKESNA